MPNREGTAILLHHSADRGDRWSDPVPVETPATRSHSRTNPHVAVNRNGVVAVTWIDTRDSKERLPAEPDRSRCHALYFTASLDGGKTFLAPARISSALSCPESTRNGAALQRWPTGGDYYGLGAAADGRFHVFWSESRNGMLQVVTAGVEIKN